LLKTFLDTLIASIGVTIPAVISAYVLLRIHHLRVRQELDIRAGGERFQRKQAAYDGIWRTLNDINDYGLGYIGDINWRKVRATQTGSLLAASPEVIGYFNSVTGIYLTTPQTEEETKKQDLEITRLMKELWNVMRKDLYNAEPLSPEMIKFVGPGNKTYRALAIWSKNRALLEKMGIGDLEGLRKMDADQVSQKTGIPSEDLVELKSMADRELCIWRDFEKSDER